MADRVMPFVRMIVPVRSCELDLLDETWVLRDPLAAVFCPLGREFPFRLPSLFVYLQLSGGLGAWELGVEVRQRLDDGTHRFVGHSASSLLEFDRGPRLDVKTTCFEFRRVPFRQAGIYEFRVFAQTSVVVGSPAYEALNGPVAELRVLDRR